MVVQSVCGDIIPKLNSNSLILSGPLTIWCDRVRLAKLPIGALTTNLVGQLDYPRTGNPIRTAGLGTKVHNHQLRTVAQNCHYDSLQTCFPNVRQAPGGEWGLFWLRYAGALW